tara:strand:- start:1564 stop:3165 length:1602 start_codon:yes stop_codon:yes gene_type:complete
MVNFYNFFKSADVQVQPRSFSNVSKKFGFKETTPVAKIRNSPEWSDKLNSGVIPSQNAKMIDGLADTFPDLSMADIDKLFDSDGFLKSPSIFGIFGDKRMNNVLINAKKIEGQMKSTNFKNIKADAEAKLKMQNEAKSQGKNIDMDKFDELIDARIKKNDAIVLKSDDVLKSSKQVDDINAKWVSCTSPVKCIAYAIVAVIAAYILIKKITELVEDYEDYKADKRKWKSCMKICLISEDTSEEDPMIVPEPSNSGDTKYALIQDSIENFAEPLTIDLSPVELNLLIKNLTSEYFDVQLFLDDYNKDDAIENLDIENDDKIEELSNSFILHEEMTETIDSNLLLKPIEELDGTTVGQLLQKIKFDNKSVTNGTSFNSELDDNKQIVIEFIIYAGLILTTNYKTSHNEENFNDIDVTESIFGRMCVTGKNKDKFGHNTHFDNYRDDGHSDASCKKYCKTKNVCGSEPDDPLDDPLNYIPDEFNPATWWEWLSEALGGGGIGNVFATLLMIFGIFILLIILFKIFKFAFKNKEKNN